MWLWYNVVIVNQGEIIMEYRVWDKITESYGGGDLWSITASGRLFYGNAEWTEGVVERFTGIYDKNGVKIYENDIVKIKLGDVYGDAYVYVVAVAAWCEDAYGFRFRDSSGKYEYFTYRRLEVIGNIHNKSDMAIRLLKGE